jgi:hypothetical protein
MLKAPTQDQPSNLQSKYREKPLQVIEKLPGDTYRVAEIVPEGQSTYATKAHISQLKSWKVLNEDPTKVSSDSDSDEDTTWGHQSTAKDGESWDNDNGTTEELREVTPNASTTEPVRVKRVRKAPEYLRDFLTKLVAIMDD